MKTYEKVINAIAGVGFLALVPVGLAVFRIYGPLDWMEKTLGFWGSATFLILVFYGLTILRILFGHAELYAPLVIGVLSSFVLMSAAIQVSFMGWYWNLVRQVPPLNDRVLLFAMAFVVLGLSVLFSSLKKFNIIAEILILVVLPFGAVVALHYAGVDLATIIGLQPERIVTP